MAKQRVYELAKQLDKSSKEIIDRLISLGAKVNNHMSVVDQKFVDELIRSYNEEKAKRAGRSVDKRGEREGASAAGTVMKSGGSGLKDRLGRSIEDDKLRRDRTKDQELRDDVMKKTGEKRTGKPAVPSREFDKPTVEGKKVIFFEKTTYFDGRSPSGGMKATHTTTIVDPKKAAAEGKKKVEEPAVKPAPAPAEAKAKVASEAKAKPKDEAAVKAPPAAADLVEPSVQKEAKVAASDDKKKDSAEIQGAAKKAADQAAQKQPPAAAKPDEAKKTKPPVEPVKEEKATAAKAEPVDAVAKKEAPAKAAAEKAERQERTERPERADRAERAGRVERAEKPEVSDMAAARRPERAADVGRPSRPKADDGSRFDVVRPEGMGAVFTKQFSDEEGRKKKKSKERIDDYLGDGERKAKVSKRLRFRDDFVDDDSDEIIRVPKRLGKSRKDKEAKGKADSGDQASVEKSGKRRDKVVKEKKIQLPEEISIKNLAAKIDMTPANLIKKFISMGTMVTINQEIDFDTASIVLAELGIEAERISENEEKLMTVEDVIDPPETLKPRPPVVTILGHVDHGKTSLLDAIRETNITASEAGGITQHIGAYQVELDGRKITFLDTPGHEAFTAMRARGAQVTDIAVLVVAADDGVMPQTVEAINHAKAAGVPILVALNKIDKPTARPDRVKQQLTEYGLVAEEWGGDTIFVEVSALKKVGIENLLEMILLVADLKELKANPDRKAKGVVIEARLDRGKGPVATVLIQKGTLRISDTIIAGTTYGRVRAMTNYKGESIEEAGPSVPVEVIGLSEVPEAGDTLFAIDDDKDAREIAARRFEHKRKEELKESQKVSLDDFYRKMQEGEIKELNIIIKADVQGSVEAVTQSLERLSTDDVRVKVIHGGVGAITEADIMLAMTSNAIVIGFNVRPDALAKKSAEREKVDVRLYRVIYDAVDDVKKALEGLLEPEFREEIVGRAEVRATFKVPKVGTVAGCYVTEGKITRAAQVRLLRDNIVLFEGKIDSLKRFKDDVREVAEGFECGIGLERFNDIKEGDIIEAFVIEKIEKKLQ